MLLQIFNHFNIWAVTLFNTRLVQRNFFMLLQQFSWDFNEKFGVWEVEVL